MTTNNTLNPRLTNYDTTWNANNLGLLNKVTPDITMVTKAIKRGTTGEVELGDFVVAAKGMVKAQVPDITAALILELAPWATVTTDQVLYPSTPNINLYTYAQLLTLHPHDKPGDTTEDLNFPKATPYSLFNLARDGVDEKAAWEVIFKIYPDVSKITSATPKVVYFYLGATVPASDT